MDLAPQLENLPPYRQMSWEKPSRVYFIASDRAVKIGVAVNPDRRLHQLQVSSPDRLRLLASIPGNYDQERYLHRAFRRERIKGEWFRASDRLIDFIAECLAQRRRTRKQRGLAPGTSSRKAAQFVYGLFR